MERELGKGREPRIAINDGRGWRRWCGNFWRRKGCWRLPVKERRRGLTRWRMRPSKGGRPDGRAARAGASGPGRGRVPLSDLRRSGAAEAGAAAVDPDPPRPGARDGNRVLLPALSPVFFSLSPRRWDWSRSPPDPHRRPQRHPTLASFWSRRPHRLTGLRCYQQAA